MSINVLVNEPPKGRVWQWLKDHTRGRQHRPCYLAPGGGEHTAKPVSWVIPGVDKALTRDVALPFGRR